MNETRARVFVIDDHPGMRDAIASFVAADFDLIGTAATAEEALRDERLPTADVLIVDVSLPRISGIDLVHTLLQRWPQLRCLMLSGHDSLTYLKRSLAAGARGYLRKEDPEEILDGIASVVAGGIFISRHFRGQIAEEELRKLAASRRAAPFAVNVDAPGP